MVYEKTEIKSDKDLMYWINLYIADPQNSKAKISDIMDMVGLNDTVTLLEEWIIEFIQLLDYYDSQITPSAKEYDKYSVWRDLVGIYNRTKPRMF